MTSYAYIADHITRIEGIHAGYPDRILDSKWRIASHLGLFPNLDPSGKLIPDQVQIIDTYIAKFKSTSAGQEALRTAFSLKWGQVSDV